MLIVLEMLLKLEATASKNNYFNSYQWAQQNELSRNTCSCKGITQSFTFSCNGIEVFTRFMWEIAKYAKYYESC